MMTFFRSLSLLSVLGVVMSKPFHQGMKFGSSYSTQNQRSFAPTQGQTSMLGSPATSNLQSMYYPGMQNSRGMRFAQQNSPSQLTFGQPSTISSPGFSPSQLSFGQPSAINSPGSSTFQVQPGMPRGLQMAYMKRASRQPNFHSMNAGQNMMKHPNYKLGLSRMSSTQFQMPGMFPTQSPSGVLSGSSILPTGTTFNVNPSSPQYFGRMRRYNLPSTNPLVNIPQGTNVNGLFPAELLASNQATLSQAAPVAATPTAYSPSLLSYGRQQLSYNYPLNSPVRAYHHPIQMFNQQFPQRTTFI